MNNFTNKIGFDRTVHLDWMNLTTNLLIKGLTPEKINQELDNYLLKQIKGKEARRKTRTVLLGVWVKTPKPLCLFRNEGLRLLQALPKSEHLAIHWGMSMAAYPFFAYVAANVGRLMHLQEVVTAIQVQRRVREAYGERETVSRATQRLLCTFLNWETVQASGTKGTFQSQSLHLQKISNPALVAWLIEAFLHSDINSSGSLNVILKNPAFFPFNLPSINSGELSNINNRIEVIRHGLDEELVVLYKRSQSSL